MPKREHPLNLELARQLTQRRRALRWSQNALALAAGLTEAWVAKAETARIPISPERHAAIERALTEADRAAQRHVPAGSAS